MSCFIGIRKLTCEEIERKLNSRIFLENLNKEVAIMGPVTNPVIQYLDIKYHYRIVDLGGGDYIEDGSPRQKADIFKIQEVKYSVDQPLKFIRYGAEKLGIKMYFDENYSDLIYFEAKRIESFFSAFTKADEMINDFRKSRSFIQFFLRGFTIDWNGVEGIKIKQAITKILAG